MCDKDTSSPTPWSRVKQKKRMMLSSSSSSLTVLLFLALCCYKTTSSLLFVSSFQLLSSSSHRQPLLPCRRHHVIIAMTKKTTTAASIGEENYNDNNKKQQNDDHMIVHQNNVFLKDRRSIIVSHFGSMTTTLLLLPNQAVYAGIDVSGLRVDGGGGGNPDLAAQLKQYDGSAASRISEIKIATAAATSTASTSLSSTEDTTISNNPYAATYAYRAAPGFNPSLTKLGLTGERYRLEDRIQGPTRRGSSSDDLRVSFEFPSDWLQLDRTSGGLQYVDQRNGDKLYLLKVTLPPNTTLTSVDKQFFGNAIFDPQGSLAKSAGITIDSYRVGKSIILNDGSLSTTPHRRLLLKYATVTGNGLVTERRGWADIFQVDSDSENKLYAYMLVTSSNAVKFEAMGRERDTVDAIVNSFRLERI